MTDRVSVIVITYRRPDSVRDCLRHLTEQVEPADQIIVIDASEDQSTAAVVAEFKEVVYIPNPAGAGNMTSSRNVGLNVADGDIVAFLDDDAYAEPGYIQNLRSAYADPTIGLACSRTLNGVPNEASSGAGGIGRLLDNGHLIGNFAFDAGAGSVVDIQHGIGATMSFRRSTLHAMGGFREDYLGIAGVREDADAFLRAGRLGFRAVFINDAVAHHVAAPQAQGKRFDLRYEYWAARNHALLLINNFGLRNGLWLRSLASHITETVEDRQRPLLRRYVRVLIGVSGVLSGVGTALRRQRGRALPASLRDAVAEDRRPRLSRS